MTKIARSLGMFIDALTEYTGKITRFLIVAITFITTAEVVSRYVFNHPTAYAWPINRQLFGLFILFAGSYAMKKGGHIRIEIFYEHFPHWLRQIARGIALATFVIFMGVLVWQSAWMGLNSLEMGERVPGGFRMPLYPFKLMIPIAALLFLLQGVTIQLRNFKAK